MTGGATLIGVDRTQALFNVQGQGVLVNRNTHSTWACDLETEYGTRFWLAASAGDPCGVWAEIASYTLVEPPSEIETVVASTNQTRGHTIPKAVTQEAQLGLTRAVRLGHQTAMSLFTGRTLAAGGQVPYPKLQHLARFFSDNPLSELEQRNAFQKTTWSLWGGDPAQRWVTSMIRKQTLALTSDGFLLDPDDLGTFDRDDVILLALTQENDPFAAEALFYVDDTAETVKVWDAGHWTDFGDLEQLDSFADRLVEVDEQTAMEIAASLDEAPGELVYLAILNPHETALAMMAGYHLNPQDAALETRVAAGVYTPAERSANAGEQPRDALGKFATVGATGTMKGGNRGTIRGINPANKYLLVEGDNGSVYSIPSRDFTIGAATTPDPPIPPQPPQPPADPSNTTTPGTAPTAPPPVPKLDLSKILAQPRALAGSPKATLDRELPPLDAAALRSIVSNYNGFIQNERNKNARKFRADHGTHANYKNDKQVYMLSLMATGDDTNLTPDTSDVKPIYMAEVDRDDPQAVLDLIALSPATSTTSEATTFRRVAGQWVRDDSVLQELKGATPPPVVVLNDADYQAVLAQVDQSTATEDPSTPDVGPMSAGGAQIFIGANEEVWEFLLAAGKNQTGIGAAERLRLYWTTGKGGIKIRWGTGGDWKRCHRLLTKYLGERSKGYCALRHREMNGYWPGDKRNLDKH